MRYRLVEETLDLSERDGARECLIVDVNHRRACDAGGHRKASVVLDLTLGGAVIQRSIELGAIEAGGRYEFGNRSEEHTSELQSLMRISYAVFCLKKQNKK